MSMPNSNSYHFVDFSDCEYKIIREGSLNSLPKIISSLKLIPEFYDKFFDHYERIRSEKRKTRRIGVKGSSKAQFYNDLAEAVKEIQFSVKKRTNRDVSKQAVFWMAAVKLRGLETLKN